MFRYGLPSAALFQVEHQHSDGTWASLAPVAADPHDPAGLDEEREWDRGHVFKCTTCEETVRVTAPREATDDGSRAG
jgi:hypothetical protein